MSLVGLAQVFEYGLLYWLTAMAAIVVYRLFNGRINMGGLLGQGPEGGVTAERVQMLFAFIIGVGGYVQLTLATLGGADPSPHFPEAPRELVGLFAGSHAVYLTGKLGRVAGFGRFLFSNGG